MISKIKEWCKDMINWIKGRIKERTTWDGCVLIGLGLVVLFLGSLVNYAAIAAIIYGIWTLIKSEW